ncbi:Aldo-keto reductase family 4 member C10 [Lecanosticta acicola]|uniref:Aldo-keto reductase family 4 member C10 n=1 Tax=Lecanosticta acicola TaxID=111012 RepID=A0AAI8YZ57_9PEZI|nr:Aldo-keto reductase family 4 member C10 [Lecanosticta acicola]
MKSILTLLPVAALALAQDQIPLSPLESPSEPLTLDAIPLLGFGTWNLKEKNTSDAVSWAIQVGYRHIDCAAAYNNEEEVGKGIADGLLKTGLTREDLWITSKLWNDKHDPNKVESGIDASLQKLGLQYLDLYHMHWPVADTLFGGKEVSYLDTWGAMALLPQKGKTRHIGVSNFSPAQLEDLLKHTSSPPAVHQMESHPYLQQEAYLEWHRNHSIHVTAYSPLGGTNPTYDESEGPEALLKSKTVNKIAKKRGCTPAQVALQWGMSRGTSVIPKSIHRDYISQNFHAPECVLKKKDLKKLAKLGEERKRYNNPSKSWGVDLYEGLEDADGKGGKARWFGKDAK